MEAKVHMVLLFLFTFLFLLSSTHSSLIPQGFINCLSHEFSSDKSIINVLYEPNNSSFEPLLESTIQNLRFLPRSSTLKPLAIITPLVYSHVQATVICCKRTGLQIRIRSGGHDYEGVSYRSRLPFVILDLRNLSSLNVNIEDNSAWVESGATLGDLFYGIAEKSQVHAFPAGLCPTVGVGGHLSGGGTGNLVRKYGLASDNIIDALIVDAKGQILDRETMGKDLFWAIRGGGAASFGVVLAWKINLVHVPPIVTVFKLFKTLEQGAINLIHKWQFIGHQIHEDVFIDAQIFRHTTGGNGTLQVQFSSLFLGGAQELLKIMDEIFPELGLGKEDCSEMSWIESFEYFADFPNRKNNTNILINDKKIMPSEETPKTYFKTKSDFILKPLSLSVLHKLWNMCLEEKDLSVLMQPYGGKMEKISESETPFPFRQGVIYDIQYEVDWYSENESSENNMNWVRKLYDYMTPYASKEPRGAYLNARDLDMGMNDSPLTTYSEAENWGLKYFKNNFERLARIKGVVDPENFFFFEQSIPPLTTLASTM
ncbi:hypothetical protein M9H77_19839 [Catharanthus roseus]|uniref:Uncharacterized protein n=1 Tax=Catharanthus roseus TaxID=4058 RepID=A0ACC0BBG8_CATRO|nr:hypothetical protein M9H77_19839 [Catharanthus roseus]